jgi:hypothetical protein
MKQRRTKQSSSSSDPPNSNATPIEAELGETDALYKAQLLALRVVDLRRILREMGGKRAGRKVELVERILTLAQENGGHIPGLTSTRDKECELLHTESIQHPPNEKKEEGKPGEERQDNDNQIALVGETELSPSSAQLNASIEDLGTFIPETDRELIGQEEANKEEEIVHIVESNVEQRLFSPSPPPQPSFHTVASRQFTQTSLHKRHAGNIGNALLANESTDPIWYAVIAGGLCLFIVRLLLWSVVGRWDILCVLLCGTMAYVWARHRRDVAKQRHLNLIVQTLRELYQKRHNVTEIVLHQSARLHKARKKASLLQEQSREDQPNWAEKVAQLTEARDLAQSCLRDIEGEIIQLENALFDLRIRNAMEILRDLQTNLRTRQIAN